MMEAVSEDEALRPLHRIGQRHAKVFCTILAALLICWQFGDVVRSHSAKLLPPSRSRRLGLAWSFSVPNIFGDGAEADDAFSDCPTLKGRVLELNSSVWPRAHTQPVPELSRIVYVNVDGDNTRSRFAEQEISKMRWSSESLFEVWRWKSLSSLKARADDWYEPFRTTGFARDDFLLQGMEEAEFTEAKAVEADDLSNSERRKWAVAAIMFTHWLVISEMSKNVPDMVENNKVWLVIDDNVKMPEKLYDFWQLLWPYVPEDWDILLLGAAEDEEEDGVMLDGCSMQFNGHLQFAARKWNIEEVPCFECQKALAYVINPKHVGRVLWRFMHSRINHVRNLLSALTPSGEDPDICPALNVFNVHPTLIDSFEFKWETKVTSTAQAEHHLQKHGNLGPHGHH
mmetsp:Transcript_16645/g.30260  ORF Transcript_16645/g.30260 Transcript_16645/m.30260 type:complete len:399 (-) Transcript_16645:125-1321(-)